MNQPKVKMPRRRYRLNKKKFVMVLLVLGCIAAIYIVAAESLVNAADVGAAASVSEICTPSFSPEFSIQESGVPKAEGLLILVNWDYHVPYDRPENLIALSEIFGNEVTCVNPAGSINAEAGAAAKEMFLKAQGEGIGKYEIASAYRSVEYQNKLWQARIAEAPGYGNDPYNNPVKVVPGRCSEHTTGLALDILAESYKNSDEGYADTPEGKWLAENAYKFGFILRYPKDKENITGVIFEPWHYRYVGKEAAQKIYERGTCLEEYLVVTG